MKGWVLAVVMLIITNTAALPNHHKHFPNHKQVEYVKTLASYEVVTPRRVMSDGTFLTHHLPHHHHHHNHHTRDKRHVQELELHYVIPLDGHDHHVTLRPNKRFLAPHAVVERLRKGSLLQGGSEVEVVGRLPSCHYHGFVRNHTSSRVAISACHGLTGFINTDHDEYLIEPVRDHPQTAPGEAESAHDNPHPHVVYKRSALPTPGENVCSTPDAHEQALHAREEWEAAHRRLPAEEEVKRKRRRRRRKRSVSVERNVEVTVVADKKMVDFYSNEDINTYILTVMNMVSSVYHDASIGNAVNIYVVRIMLLEDPQYEEEVDISHNADDTLRSFCHWQQMINPGNETHPYHHDVAVLITRYNICSRVTDRCATLGVSEIAGMCQPLRSCNVNEDTGLQIAYTIAHELGHNFGMNHDGPQNGCESHLGSTQHVMSPHLTNDAIPVTWSNCSRHEITHFLDKDWGSCLEDEPPQVEYSFPQLPPGAMYDADHQCRLSFGSAATHCAGIEGTERVCQTLWCHLDNRCITRMEPAAEGTQCGKHKWCASGQCVTIGERPAAIHGNWGSWSSWSSCSRSCGAGVSNAHRHCDNPAPANGGKYCTGDRRKYRVCNTQECPENGVSFRAIQCSQHNQQPYKGEHHNWLPVMFDHSPCQLDCKPDNEFYSVKLRDTVVDGTPCKPGTRDMCIHGVCKRVACDWSIEGAAQEDRCGLCHGDGTQCVTTRGVFNVTRSSGYVSAVTFPRLARNVKVRELRDAANYLALRDNATGRYFLNGNWIIQWSGEYSADGTMMYYTRDGEAEELFLPGPVKRPLTLMLLFQTENPGLAWEYTLPQHDVTYTPTFTWLHSDWSVCTVTCGEGTQVSKVQCMEKEAGLVEEQYCRGQQKPSDRSRACNKHACPAWWWSGPWQPCAITCGSGGVRRRTVICVRSFGPTQQMALLDSACDDSDKPHETEVCPTLPPCPQLLEWSVGAWSQSCTLDPCDFEEREVLCVAPGENCDPLSRPPDRRQCGNLTCGVWQVGSWSKCSSPCGEGVQFRPVSCEGGLACREIDEPKSVQECIGNCLDDETHLEINDDLMDELLSLSISAVTTPKGILATTPGVTSTTTPASISSTTPVNISSATPTGTFSTSLVDISTTTPGSISSTTLSHTISTTPTDIPSTISVDISTMAPESISSTTPAGMFSTIREVTPSSNPGSISTMTPLGTSSTTISSPTLGSASSTTKVGVFSTSASTNILPTTSTPPHTSTSLTTSTVLSITTAAVPTFHTVSLTSESSSTEPASYDLPLPPIITTLSTSNEASTSEALATAPTIEFSNFYPTDETTVEILRSSTTIPSKNSRSKTLITQPETMTDPPSTTASVFTSLPVVDSNTPETTTASVSTSLPVADSNIPETSTTAAVFTSLPVEESNIPETSTIKLVSTSLPVAGSNILETSITASVSTSLPVEDSNIPETSTTTSETSTTFISTSLPVADSNIPETLTTVSIPTGLPAADSSIPETTTVAPVSGPTTALLPVKYSPEIGTLANGEVAEKRYSVEDDHEASKVAFEDNDRADNDVDDTTDAAAQKLNSTLSEDNIENIQKDKAASFKENMSDAHDTLGDTVSETLPETDHENIHVLESFSEVDVESKTLKPEDKMVLNNRSSAEEKLPDGEIHPESQIPDNTQVSASPTSADDDLKTGEAPLVTEAPTQWELSSELEESTEEEEVEAEEQRPDGIIEDKINVDDFEVIEILELPPKTNGKKHRKKVLLHSGAKAVDVLYELAEEQAAKKAATTFLPNNSLDNMVPKYQWNISNWSECSVECGGGKQLRSVTCQDLSSNTPVHPQLCILPAPQNVQSCNTVECGEWRVGEWSACSSLCELGERVRSVECVEGERCLSHTRPTEVEACNLGPCVQWVEGPWSLCTKTCGGGYQIRHVKCVEVRTQEAADTCTRETKPKHKMPCQNERCPKNRRGQQRRCRDRLDTKLCKRLKHMCTTKFFRVKCCRTCLTRGE